MLKRTNSSGENTLKYASDVSHVTEAYSEPCQTSKTERFAKLFNGF